MPARPRSAEAAIRSRLRALDWRAIEHELWETGYARAPAILTARECSELIRLYPQDRRFRSRIEMERYRFGIGSYAYFARPLPDLVQNLRTHAYARLAPIANRWLQALRHDRRFPPTLTDFLSECAAAGQRKPTPLLLRYEAGGYNCLHSDLYGEIAFPFQMACFLSRREADYAGGEFLLVEQRPRAQSKAEVITPDRGEMIVFPTASRPVAGRRGFYRTGVRHGVSRVRSGQRHTLGIIFHDAR